MFEDYRFKTKIVYNDPVVDLQDLYLNSALPFSIEIEKKDPLLGNYNFSYTALKGKGLLFYCDSLLNPSESINCEGNLLSLRFIPTSSGEFQLKFNFENDIINVANMLTGKAEKNYFSLIPEDLPNKLIIDNPFLFSLKLTKPDDDNVTARYKTETQITEGSGNIFILNHNQDSSTKYLIPGKNIVSYTGTKEGTNVIRFNIQNEFNLSQSVDIPLNIQLPDVTLKVICDTTLQAGTNNFILMLENTDGSSNNNYWIGYRNLKNAGKLKIAGSEIKVGNLIEIFPGETICEFIPMNLGEAQLEFSVKDKYNTIRKDTAIFKVINTQTDISVSNFNEKFTVNDLRYFNFAVSKKNYSGNFKFEILQHPLESVELSVNGNSYVGGKSDIINKENTIVGYIPQKLGNGKLTLIIYDDYNSSTTKELSYDVINSAGKINVSNHNPSINLFTPTSFNFSVEKPNYNNTFQFEITSVPVNAGKIIINGLNYDGGLIELTNPNNTLVSFTPSTLNDVTLTLKVHDKYGGLIQKDITYNIGNTDIDLMINGLEKDLIVNKETSFNFTAKKPFFEGKLNCSITALPADMGILQVNGNSYISNLTALHIGNNSNNTVSFLPVKEGKVTLSVNVSDSYNGIKSYPINYNIINPDIYLEITDYSEKATLYTEQKFKFTIKKTNYSDKFKLKLISSSDLQEIRLNEKVYNGETIDLENSENNTVSLIPAEEGSLNLTLQITDNTNKKIERTLNFKVENPQLQIKIAKLEDELTLDKQTSFNLSIQKANYSGNFFLELLASNCKDIKIDNAEYSLASRVLLQNPDNTIISFIPSSIGSDSTTIMVHVLDEWGLSCEKQVRFHVNNSDITLDLNNLESQLFVGKPTKFQFVSTKAFYTNDLEYELISSPAGLGKYTIEGKDYISGRRRLLHADPVEVIFTPEKSGEVDNELIVTDKFGGKKTKTFTFTITNPAINAEITDFVSNATLNTESFFYLSLKKEYYDGPFYCSVTTVPANAEILRINDTLYTGGRFICNDARSIKFGFKPLTTGDVRLNLNIADNTGSIISKELKYTVVTYPILLTVSNQETGLTIDKSTDFNFSVSKQAYSGKFYFEITSEPVKCGTFKIDDESYQGGRIEFKNKNNTRVSFVPKTVGDIRIFLKIYDEEGNTENKQLNFSVVNSNLGIVFSNQERNIQLGKPTSFNLTVLKPNYSGSYQYEIIQNPENNGTIIIDKSIYQNGKHQLVNPVNTIVEYTALREGTNSLIFNIYDENQGIAQKTITYNVINPPILLNLTNKAEELIINTPSNFNIALKKEYYKDSFDFQIETIPANSGEIIVDGEKYNGGFMPVADHENLHITFIPDREGNVSLKFTAKDKVGGIIAQDLVFHVINPDIKLEITNHITDITVNLPTLFNFVVSKSSYPGKFYYQISQQPANAGTIKVNNNLYTGNKLLVSDPNSNSITFTANQTGAVTLYLTITDEWDKTITKLIPYSVSNSDIHVNTTGKEYSLLLNKPTQFQFNIEKPNYVGKFKATVEMEPEDAGTLKINGSGYTESWTDVQTDNNQVEFNPQKTGAILLRLKVQDELKGEKEIALNYNVVNPDIKVNVTNKEDHLNLKSPTNFNIAIAKDHYDGIYEYELYTSPANSGTILINGSSYSGGIINVTNPANTRVEFTPDRSGFIVFYIHTKDQTGAEITKTLNFNVIDPPLNLSINNAITSISTGQMARFTFRPEKTNYTGNFTYELTPYPYNSGVMTIDGKEELSGATLSKPVEVNYIPDIAGSVSLKIKVSDNWGNTTEKQINFSVSNTPLTLNILNNESNVVVNQPTTFNISAFKKDYADDKNIYYSVSPAKNLTINSQAYTGGILQTKYGTLKSGIPIQYVPDREGNNLLTFYAYDEYNQTVQKTIDFNTTNPDLKLFLSGVNEEISNPVNLNGTFKFTVNVDKDYYNDEFAYWITTTPSDAALVATSDVTPRSRSVNGSGTITGTLEKSLYGMSTAEIRITPNNSLYVDRDINLGIRVRDKWGNEKTKNVTFQVTTSAMMVNVVRNHTSIPVQQPYLFYFTISKPGYSGKFKYSISGADNQDILEISEDANNFQVYNGGKFEVPDPDHTYIRFTPYAVGTSPLRLTVYDENNSWNEIDIAFDVKAPKVTLTGGGVKSGLTEEFIPFSLTAQEEKGETMNIAFEIDPALDGEVLFNRTNVFSNRSRASIGSVPITSGSHSLEIMSRRNGQYTANATVSNIWNNTASVSSTVNVSEPQSYTLDLTIEGQGRVEYTQKTDYKPGEKVSFTAIAEDGWLFSRWEGDLTGSVANQTITMNSHKKIKAVFIKNPAEPVNVILKISSGAIPPPSEGETAYFSVLIKEASSQKTIYSTTIHYPTTSELPISVDIDKTQNYIIEMHIAGSPFRDEMRNKQYEVTQSAVLLKFADGSNRQNGNDKYYYDTNYTVPGSIFFGNIANEIIGSVSYKSSPINTGFDPSTGHAPNN